MPLNKRLILTVKEASEYSGLDEDEIRRLLKRWDCDFYIRVGRIRMVKRKELDNYINQIRPVTAEVPIWKKELMTLDEAAAYTNIGTDRLRELMNGKKCKFVKVDGQTKRIIRKKFGRVHSKDEVH